MSARHAQAYAHVDLGMDNQGDWANPANQKDREDLKNPNTQNVRMENANDA